MKKKNNTNAKNDFPFNEMAVEGKKNKNNIDKEYVEGHSILDLSFDDVEISSEDRDNIVAFLKEYLEIFKNKKEHQKFHKNEPCYKCELAKKILRRLEK